MNDTGSIIDKNSIIPIYYQLIQYIKKKIENNVWKVGDKIPSEREFCDCFQISRMTVRGAIETLKNDGLICSKRGVGNFVSFPKLNQKLNKLSSFTDDMISRGLKPESQTLFLKAVTAPRHAAEVLNIAENDKVVNLRRLRMANDEPMALEEAYIVYNSAPNLLTCYKNGDSLYQTLKEKCGINIINATESIEIGVCNKKDAKLLKIAPNSPVFLIHRVSFIETGRPIEYVCSMYRADRYAFTINLVT